MSTTACVSLPACRQVAAHSSLCRLPPLPPPMLLTQQACRPLLPQFGRCLDQSLCIAQCVALCFCLNLSYRVRKRVHQRLRKSASVSTIPCASLSVWHSVSASTSSCDSTSVLTTACPSRPPCQPVAANILVCRLPSLIPPLLPSQPACRPLLTQVRQRVDYCLRIAQCVAYRLCLHF